MRPVTESTMVYYILTVECKLHPWYLKQLKFPVKILWTGSQYAYSPAYMCVMSPFLAGVAELRRLGMYLLDNEQGQPV